VFKKDGVAFVARDEIGGKPPAYSVSEREADDQTDCSFKHSDKRMGRDENPAPSVKRLKGGVSRDPRRVPA
jgi:hypothetical protein